RQCAARPAASDDQHVGRVAGRPRCRQRHLREYRTTCRPWRLLLVLLVLLVLLALGERPLVMLVLLVRLLPGREVTVSVRSIPSHGVLPSPFGLVCARTSLHPIKRPGPGLLPQAVLLVALRRIHPRLPLLVFPPVRTEILYLLPEADRQPGRIGRTERRGLGDGGADHRNVEDVRLELHQGLVVDHPAIDLEG